MLGFEQQLLSSIAEFRRLESESLPPGLSVAEVESYLRHKGAVNAGIMKETNALINEQLLPLLASGQDISDEVADALYKLSQDLYSLSHSLDMGLALTIHTYLLQRARARGDVSRIVRHLYWAGMISMMFHNTLLNAEAISLLQEGASYRSNYHLIKDRETRLFINRCLGNVYVAISRLRNHSEEDVSLPFSASVDEALRFWNDEAVRAKDPDFPWTSFINNSHQNVCAWVDYLRQNPTNSSYLAQRIYHSIMELAAGDTATLGSRYWEASRTTYMISCARYHVGEIALEEHLAALSAISQKMADDDYSPEGMYCKLFIPSVFLNYLKHASQLSETERMTRQQAVVNKVLRYCQAAPSGVDKQRLNEYLGYFGKECIDHSQAETYLDLLLRFTSLSHIYTYIHSLQVEMLVTVFLNYLITTSPELLVGLSDTNSVEEVVAKGENILALGRRAGLCHDIGKITYTNTVALCSRHLYDFEFNLIKKHVNVVDEFPENDEIIDSIRDVIIGHHKWYDGSKGYPLDFDNTASKYKIIIDIVSVADSIDAATDAIGRSYAPPNSFARVVQEIKDQAGTRYSPYLAAALNDVAFLQELELVITAKRRLSYYKAYSTILGDA